MEFTVRSVAVVRAGRAEASDDHWDEVPARIELDEAVPSEAIEGLAAFSHLEVVFLADRASDVPPAPWARHPRGREDWPRVGIFAQRAKDRPNRILTTVVQILSVEGRTIHVRGLDAIDGTPVLDLKPWLSWLGPRGELREPGYATEIGRDYH